MFDVEITRTESGCYTAVCNDLHLACEGQTQCEALHRMQSLIFFFLSAPGDVSFGRNEPAPNGPTTTKLVHIPIREFKQ